MKRPTKNRAGFSLLEVIVVVTILLILSAIVISMMGRLGETSEIRKCAANLRHVGIALLAYVAESGNQLSSFAGGQNGAEKIWGNQLYEGGHVDDKRLFRCEQGDATLALEHAAWHWYTYGMNMLTPPGVFLRYNDPDGSMERRYQVNLNAVAEPSRHILLFDSAISPTSKVQIFRMEYSGKSGIKLRHEGKANVFFLDGHMRAMNRKQIQDIVEWAEHENPTWPYIFD